MDSIGVATERLVRMKEEKKIASLLILMIKTALDIHTSKVHFLFSKLLRT